MRMTLQTCEGDDNIDSSGKKKMMALILILLLHALEA
jgi:hypothetical protein